MALEINRQFEIDIDGSRFVFTKPTKRDLLEWKEGKDTVAEIFKKLVAVYNFNDNGTPVTASPDLHLDLPVDVTQKIIAAWNERFYQMMGITKESLEKKASTPSLNGSSSPS